MTSYLADHPVAAAGRLVRRAGRAAGLRDLHHHRHRRRRLVGQQAVRRPRRPTRPGHRHLGVRSAFRHHRRPDLPRHHRQPAVLRRGPQPLERVRHLERRAGHLGRDRLRRGRRLDRLPLLQGAAGRRTRTRWPRASPSRRRSAGSATTSTRSSSARPTSVPWGLEVFVRTPGGVAGAVPAERRLRVPDRLRQGRPRGALRGLPADVPVRDALEPAASPLVVVLADKRFQLGGGRAFAVYVAGYTLGRAWIEMLRIDPANHIFGLRINVFTSVIVFLGAVRLPDPAPERRPGGPGRGLGSGPQGQVTVAAPDAESADADAPGSADAAAGDGADPDEPADAGSTPRERRLDRNAESSAELAATRQADHRRAR